MCERYPSVPALRGFDTLTGEWKEWTYKQLHEDVTVVSKSFLAAGLKRLHSVVILGTNSPYWVIASLAAISSG